jgi:hypothetical protein
VTAISENPHMRASSDLAIPGFACIRDMTMARCVLRRLAGVKLEFLLITIR